MAWFNFQRAPKALVAPGTSQFTAPKSRTSLRPRSFQYEGHGGINAAIRTRQVASNSSVYAPPDLGSLRVLQDARNRVGF